MARTFYIAANGNDSTGDGSSGARWASLSKACSIVTTPGDTIHVTAGTYIEANQCILAPGVSIVGEGTSSHIVSHYQANWNSNNPHEASITLLSASEGTVGSQTISNLLLDGDNLTANSAILVRCRSGVVIHDITIQDFNINGICYIGSSADVYTQPTTYSANNELYNVIINNCTGTAETYLGGGLINMSGQKDLAIHDCTFTQNSRTAGNNGDILVGNWWGLGFKYYNNTSYKPYTGHDGWNFHLEIPNECAGAEIYNNRFFGGDCMIDSGNNGIPFDESYTYSYWIHHNYFQDLNPTELGDHGKGVITCEGTYVKNILVEHNTFQDCQIAFNLTDGNPGATNDTNIVFANNLLLNVGQPVAGSFIDVIGIEKNHAGGTLQDVYLINNTIIPNPDPNTFVSFFRLTCNNGSTMNNVVVANNICKNSLNYWMRVDNTGGTLDSLTVRNNILFNNRSNNLINFSGNTVTNYVNISNSSSDPLLTNDSDCNLQAGSPAIGAGFDYGRGTDIGAIQYVVPNVPPVANAGTDQTITLPTNSVTLTGSGSTDSDGSIVLYQWTQLVGPSAATMTNSSTANATAGNLIVGSYQFRLTITDNQGATASKILTVTVNPVPNVLPVASAGNDNAITLPTNSVTLSGSGTDSDGMVTSYQWTKLSGPTSGPISNATSATATATGLVTGVYQFQLTVTDDRGGTTTDIVQVTVNPEVVAPPSIAVPANIEVTLPTNNAVLMVQAAWATGHSGLYEWSQIGGETVTLLQPLSNVAGVIHLLEGIYQFRCVATQDDGQTASVDLTVTVKPAPVPPPDSKYTFTDNKGNARYFSDYTELVDTSFTLSYSIEGDSWVFFHDYLPDFYFHTREQLWTVKDSHIYKHNSGKPGVYYNEASKPFFIDVVFKSDSDLLLETVNWITESLSGAVDDSATDAEWSTFTHISIWNSQQHSGRIALRDLPAPDQPYRKTQGEWSFDDFRNVLADRGMQFLMDIFRDYALDQTKTAVKGFYDQELLEDKYFVIRFEFDNTTGRQLVLHQTNIQAIKSDR